MDFLSNKMASSLKITLLISYLFLTSCNHPRPPLPQPADVRPKKTTSFGNTYSQHRNHSKLKLENGEEINDDSKSRGFADLSWRYSITNRFDMGARFGLGGAGIDLRYQIVKSKKYPSISIGAGWGVVSYFSGMYISKKYNFGNFFVEPLVNINYTKKRNQFWIPLPEKYKTYESGEVAGVYSEIMEDGRLIDFVFGLGVGKSDEKEEISIYLGVVPQHYYSKEIFDQRCINCDVRASTYDHHDDMLFVLSFILSSF